jgi:hypothetical protein
MYVFEKWLMIIDESHQNDMAGFFPLQRMKKEKECLKIEKERNPRSACY